MTNTLKQIALLKLQGWDQRTEGMFTNGDLVGILPGSALADARKKLGFKDPMSTPDYLGNAQLMAEVFAKLSPAGWTSEITMRKGGLWWCALSIRADDDRRTKKAQTHIGAGPTLSEAMAEAYLRMKGAWED